MIQYNGKLTSEEENRVRLSQALQELYSIALPAQRCANVIPACTAEMMKGVQTRRTNPPRMRVECCRREQVPVSRQESVFLT